MRSYHEKAQVQYSQVDNLHTSLVIVGVIIGSILLIACIIQAFFTGKNSFFNFCYFFIAWSGIFLIVAALRSKAIHRRQTQAVRSKYE